MKWFCSCCSEFGNIVGLCICTAVSAAKDAVGQIDVNKAMEYKAKFDELTSDESNKKDD